MVKYLPLPPVNWPQDKARIPAGLGGMPPVEYNNRSRVEAEYTTMYGEVVMPANHPVGASVTIIIPTAQDGDFWCDQISMVVVIPGTFGVDSVPAPSNVVISDIRTGNFLTYPYVPSTFFSKIVFITGAGTGTPSPSFFRDTATLIQPYCFTRQGGIQLSNIAKTLTPTYTLCFAFSGWKEYANASH